MKKLEIFKESSAFRSICEAAVEGIILIDDDGQILSVNKAVGAMFGYESDELLGNSIEKLVPTQLKSNHGDSFKQNIVTISVGKGIIRGTERWF